MTWISISPFVSNFPLSFFAEVTSLRVHSGLHTAWGFIKMDKTSACRLVSPVYKEVVDWSGWRSGGLLGSARVSAPRWPLWASVSTSWEWVDWAQVIALRELGINVRSLYLDPQTVNSSHDSEFSIFLKPGGHWKDDIITLFLFFLNKMIMVVVLNNEQLYGPESVKVLIASWCHFFLLLRN